MTPELKEAPRLAQHLGRVDQRKPLFDRRGQQPGSTVQEASVALSVLVLTPVDSTSTYW